MPKYRTIRITEPAWKALHAWERRHGKQGDTHSTAIIAAFEEE